MGFNSAFKGLNNKRLQFSSHKLPNSTTPPSINLRHFYSPQISPQPKRPHFFLSGFPSSMTLNSLVFVCQLLRIFPLANTSAETADRNVVCRSVLQALSSSFRWLPCSVKCVAPSVPQRQAFFFLASLLLTKSLENSFYPIRLLHSFLHSCSNCFVHHF